MRLPDEETVDVLFSDGTKVVLLSDEYQRMVEAKMTVEAIVAGLLEHRQITMKLHPSGVPIAEVERTDGTRFCVVATPSGTKFIEEEDQP